MVMPDQKLWQQLRKCLTEAELITDPELRAIYSHDIAGGDAVAAAIIRPVTIEAMSKAVSVAAGLGYALVPRGSGHSYSGGTVPSNQRAVVIDVSNQDQVLEIDGTNRIVRVQAGCTWAMLLEALEPHGLRTPFFGPLSGFRSTIGGALSQRATFFGSAMHGFSDNSVVGQTIVLADGRILTTGNGHDGRPHPQPSGPDEGALFVGDCGAFGIKAEASLRLIKRAGAEAFASFAYDSMAAMLAAQVALSGSEGMAECFGFDRQAHINLAKGGFEVLEGLEIVRDVLGQQGSPTQRLGRMVQLFRKGKRKVMDLQCSLHLCIEGEDEDHARARLARAGAVATRLGGEAVPDTIPRVTRSRPFRPIKALLGSDGERWLPFHGVFRLGDIVDAHAALATTLVTHAPALLAHEIKISFLTVSSGDTIILEPHLFWPDSLHKFHRHHVTNGQLKRFGDRPEQPQVRAFAHNLRRQLGDVLHKAGAEHLQIGRHYPYEQDMDPLRRELMQAIKRMLDPDGLMAPGTLFSVELPMTVAD